MSDHERNALLWQWVRENRISAEELAAKLERSPSYMLGVLMGHQPLTDSVMGAFLRVFGPAAAAAAFGLEQEAVQ